MIIESKYYGVKNAKPHDIITILSNPTECDTQYGKKVKCQIDRDGAKMEWTISNTALRNISNGFGNDTAKWVGKKVEIVKDKTKQGVEFLNATPIEEL